MTQTEEIAQLNKQLGEMLWRLSEAEKRESQLLEQVSGLRDELSEMQAEKQGLQEQLAVAHQRIEELQKQKTPPPAFAKANVKKPKAGEKKPRKKREAQHNHGRRRETPTRMVDHWISSCPECASRLGGVSVARRLQVI